MAAKLVVDEARHIAQRKLEEQSCGRKEGMRSTPIDRGNFPLVAGSIAGVFGSTATFAQKVPPGAVYYDVSPDSTKVFGRPVAGDDVRALAHGACS